MGYEKPRLTRRREVDFHLLSSFGDPDPIIVRRECHADSRY